MATINSKEIQELPNEALLQPGQSIRPVINCEMARKLVKSLYGLTPTELTELNSYDDRNFFLKISSKYLNKHVECIAEDGYVLKILNTLDSQKHHVEAEHEVLKILIDRGFHCPTPVLNIHGQDKSVEKIYYDNSRHDSNQQRSDSEKDCDSYGIHTVRLLTYVRGNVLLQVPYSPSLLYSVGNSLGRFDSALKDFSHPALDVHQTIWSLDNLEKISEFTYAISSLDDRRLVEEIVKQFSIDILPQRKNFKKGAIHGDYNDQNVIVRECSSSFGSAGDLFNYEVFGMIDFGDMNHSYYVYEVAITIMYAMLSSSVIDPMDVGGHILAGYLREMTLEGVEVDSLKTCIAARYAQSLTMGAYSYSLDPTNEYLLSTSKNGWKQLRELWQTSKVDLLTGWRKVMLECYGIKDFNCNIGEI